MTDMQDTRIPVTLLTGFLGSGKTTLLNHWIKQPELGECAVLINEFGSVGLDHHLVQQVDEQVMLLDSGCICCSVQGSLVEALQGLFMKAIQRKIKPFKRLIIETTGLADPAPVLFTLREEGFIAQRYRFDGTVTVVDAGHIEQQLVAQYEAVKQVALADLLVVSKGDLVDGEQLARVETQLAALNPAAPIQLVTNGELSPAVLEKLGAYNEAAGRDVRQLLAWLRTESPSRGWHHRCSRRCNRSPPRLARRRPPTLSTATSRVSLCASASRSSPLGCWLRLMRCRPNTAMLCCGSRGSCSWKGRASRW